MKPILIFLLTAALLVGIHKVAADQNDDASVRVKALGEELRLTTDRAEQIQLKQELAQLTTRRDRRDAHGRLDQGGDNWLDAAVLPSLPAISATGTTTDFANDFNVADLPLPPSCWQDYYDPLLTCSGPDVAYRYVIPQTGVYRISLCALPLYDTGLLVYYFTGGPPSNFTDLICGNDDFCGVISELLTPELPAGIEVMIVVDGWNGQSGDYQIDIELTEQVIPPNDICLNPQFLESFSPVTGTTEGATLDDAPECGTTITAPGVWYTTFGTGNTMTAHTCLGAEYDTKLNVFGGSCSEPVCVGGNDDACGLQSMVTWCSVAGEAYLILVQGYDGQTGNFTLIIEDDGVVCTPDVPFYSIPEVYAQRDILMGQQIDLLAYATTESILVEDWIKYITDQKFPDSFYMQISGGVPINPIDQDGAWLQLTGIVGEDFTNPDVLSNILFTPVAYTVLTPNLPVVLANWRPATWTPSTECDTCKFGVLISGGWKGTTNARGSTGGSNRADYWDNLADFYCYKRSHGWCENRMKVFYYKGERPTGHTRRTDIPAGVVDSCWESKIQAHFTAISSQIAACARAGKCPTVEVMATNHGDSSSASSQGGISMVHSATGEDTTMTGREFRMAMQQLVDSGLCNLDAEFGHCYSGIMVNELIDSLDSKGCNVTASSSTSHDKKAYSRGGDGGYSLWLNPKVCALQEGRSLQEAVNIANKTYDKVHTDQVAAIGARAAAQNAIAGDPNRPIGVRTRAAEEVAKAVAEANDVNTRVGKGRYLRSFCLPKRCTSDTIQVTRGGRIDLKFSGPAKSCGNCEVLCQDTLGKWVRLSQWNWNVPGSAEYVNGQNARRIESSGASNGIYVVHSRSDSFCVKAVSTNPPLPPSLDTDISNPEEFAGFAIGWTSGTSDEFGNIVTSSQVLPGADDNGFDLTTAPKILGPGGAEEIEAYYDVLAANYWWSSMQVYVQVLGGSPGTTLTVECPDCDVNVVSATLSGGDEEVVFPVGAAGGVGPHAFTLTSDLPVELDCWGFESAHSTGIPPAVTDLVVIRDGDDIKLYWSAVPVAVSYLVQTAASDTGPWATVGVVFGASFTHTGQANASDEQLYYQVIGVGP
jgi:hypothetical protein